MERTNYQKVSQIVNDCIAKETNTKTNKFCFREMNNLIYFVDNSACASEDESGEIERETKAGVRVFDEIFGKKAECQKKLSKTYFHYKKFEYAFDLIEKEYITLSALSNYANSKFDDLKEYEHFFDIVQIGTFKSYIEEQKKGFYILCLTEDNTTKRFWEEYADYYKGLCIEMEIQEKNCEKWYLI